MSPPPDGGNIVDMPEPRDTWFAAPSGNLDLWNAGWIRRVRRAGKKEIALNAGRPQYPLCLNQSVDALVGNHPPCEGHGHLSVRFRNRPKSVGIDARPGNQRNTFRLAPKPRKDFAIVRVLHQSHGTAAIQTKAQQQASSS